MAFIPQIQEWFNTKSLYTINKKNQNQYDHLKIQNKTIKIQPPFRIKTFQSDEGNTSNLIKDIHDTANILSSEKKKAFPFTSTIRQGCLAYSPLLFNTVLEVLAYSSHIKEELSKRYPDCEGRSKTVTIYMVQNIEILEVPSKNY